MKAIQCDECRHIMTNKEYDDFPECPMCGGHYVTSIRYRKCDCGVCKAKRVKTVTTNGDYAQFVLGLGSANRTNHVEESFLHAASGMAGESGELLDELKKVWWQRHPMNEKFYKKIILELGDILFYMQFMCNNLGVTLDDVRDKNVEKLSKRYESGKYTVKESLNREDS